MPTPIAAGTPKLTRGTTKKGNRLQAPLPTRNREMFKRRVGLILPLFLTIALPLWGQDSYPKGEVFGGYAFSHYTLDFAGQNLNGWGASVSGNFTRSLGLTADFSGAYGSDLYAPPCATPAVPVIPAPPCPVRTQNLSAYHFLAGPRFTRRTHGPTVFAHALIGVANIREEFSGTGTGFAMGFGGGVDIPVGKRWAYRLFQADYIPAKRAHGVNGWDHAFLLETGFVLTFGKK